jgi:hypothetical protein
MEFPVLPEGFWRGTASPHAALEFVVRVQSWRRTTIEALRGPLPDPKLTAAMGRLLLTALGGDAPLPRQVRRFPSVGTSEETAVADAREIALWRASLIDYVSDVWDVIGEPEFDLPECAAAERLLDPLGPTDPSEAPRCPYCLELLPRLPGSSGFAVHDYTCPALRALRAPQ